MDVSRFKDVTARRTTLARILKLLRRRAGLRSSEAAREMGKALRTYQRWESGEYGVEIGEIHRFADIVRADPWGIILGVEFGSVEFAMNTADNNAASLMLVALRRYDRKSGGDIRKLDGRSLVLVFTKAFEQLSARAQEFEADLEQWMFDEGLGANTADDDDD